VQDLLIAWGRGRSINSAPNGYPPKAAFAVLISRGNLNAAGYTEEELERVDRYVSDMKLKKPIHHAIIALHYVERMTDARTAHYLRKHGSEDVRRAKRTWVRETRLAAEHWIEGRLESA
jgi:hypothetical protein